MDIAKKLLELNVLTGDFIFAAPKNKEAAARQALMDEIINYVNGLEARVAFLRQKLDDCTDGVGDYADD